MHRRLDGVRAEVEGVSKGKEQSQGGRARRATALLMMAALATVLGWWMWPVGSFEVLEPAPAGILSMTPLADGRVVCAGKDANDRSALWVYSPKRKRWTMVARPPRGIGIGHSATALGLGRVLFIGGVGSGRSVLIYMANLDRYLEMTSPPLPRNSHTAVRLWDGRVLVAGGLHAEREETTALGSLEIFDPDANAWIPAGVMKERRVNHTASLLPDGRVLIVGGVYPGQGMLSSTEIFDPVAWKVTPGPDTGQVREAHHAHELDDGRVLIFAGTQSTGWAQPPLDTAQIFDPEKEAWIDAAPMKRGRRDSASVKLPDGRIMAIGGWWRPWRRGLWYYFWRVRELVLNRPSDGFLTSTEIYDPKRDRWNDGPNLNPPQDNSPSAVYLPEEGVLTVGFDGLVQRWVP